MTVTLSSSLFASPSSENSAQGATAVAGMVVSIAISVEKFIECAEENYFACVVAVAGVVAAGAQGYSAVQSFTNADATEGGGYSGSIPTVPGSGNTTFGGDEMPEMPTRNQNIINAINGKLADANALLDQLRAKGIDVDGIMANPGDFLTDEEMAEFQAGAGSLKKEITDEEAEQAVEDLLAESGDITYGASSSIGNQGGVFAPSRRSKFKLDKFLI